MVKEQIVQHAMQIILHAGDARKHCMDALKAIESYDFALAESKQMRRLYRHTAYRQMQLRLKHLVKMESILCCSHMHRIH